MDIELARTFLEIAAAGTLSKAAERLHLTQATISARLQKLESELGAALFVRNKSGTRLTAAGELLIPYATQLTQIWARAQRTLASAPNLEGTLSLGGEFSLWSAVLLNWLVALRQTRPGTLLRSQVDSAAALLESVQHGRLDVAVLYSPLRRPGVVTNLVLEEELVAVSTDPDSRVLQPRDYVYVDWGPDFAAQHSRAFPELEGCHTFVGLGPLALRYLLKIGGAGYFRTRAVAPYCADGRLHRVPGTPRFSYSLYAIHSERADAAAITWALEQLQLAAQQPIDSWA
jgi:LysR family transcriptional regulator, flagellar master operon regulator